MPLARIITRFPQDASPVAEYLASRGYDVEITDPLQAGGAAADIELSVDRCSSPEALARAAALAEAGGVDVFVAPGALKMPVAVNKAVMPRVASVEASEIPAAAQLMEASDQLPIASDAASAVAVPAEQTHQAADADATSAAGPVVSDVPVEVQPVESQYFERPHNGVLQEPPVMSPSPVPEYAGARQSPPASEPAKREQFSYARSVRRQSANAYWRGAFTGAAVAAIAVMVAWVAASGRPPSTPQSSDGRVVQNVPFGPVTLTPAPAATKATVTTPAAQVPVPSTTAAKMPQAAPRITTQPAPQNSVRKTRRARASSDEGDEVIVRHFNAAAPKPPATATLNKSGPRRITDQ